MPAATSPLSVCFSHVHFYCDALKEAKDYRKLETQLNAFAKRRAALGAAADGVAAGREAWLALQAEAGAGSVARPEDYKAVGQDLVEQLLVGLGWRITGSHEGVATRSLVVTSCDPDGVKFVITSHTSLSLDSLAAKARSVEGPELKRPRCLSPEEPHSHFDAAQLERFAACHAGRQGVAVLGFVVCRGGTAAIRSKYEELHPKLLCENSLREYRGATVLEVFAYYRSEKLETEADPGTILRFVEVAEEDAAFWVLPGVQRVDAQFDGLSQPAFCDHWVSNVFSRTGFLDTLNDTLGFTPKVDFNAGVVAAGEAQIESTVTGNSPPVVMSNKNMALRDQSQVYLPINNALSEVGHVHVFLRELGQGVQHIASRVEDLAALIQGANDQRRMTGAGLSFLQIPRSYYGYLTAKMLAKSAGIEAGLAEECVVALRRAAVLDARDVVDMDVSREQLAAALPAAAPASLAEHVLRARYGNLYALLGDHVSEETYLRIVRNNILVDIQGQDLLMQIFTSKVLQRGEGEEAPFLEFIQRVCSENCDAAGCPKPIKPGCGGFGIRNFLTLFLSIEVSKAAAARAEAERAGDVRTATLEARRVDAFTAQLDESNPILTAISDAMTAEASALERGNAAEAARWAAEKARGQECLQAVSGKYKEVMRRIREEEKQV